ncbi:hypothetical protein N0V82_001750 [Gnomoniopsis sp. IMI 355080]|nr:hypothetical protein N0V82_001750 [Gnomoniopsis sp. IMI 355080]
MKFQSMLIAVSAISAAACPAKQKPSTTSASSSVAPAATSAPAAAANAASSSTTTEDSSSNTTSSSGSSISGEATFYGGNISGGTCSFTTLTTIPNGLYGTAYSGEVWDNAAMCGACVKVTGPSGDTITAMIVDECPECDQGHLDLFEDGFLKLGTASEGIIDISYEVVECGITSPLVLHNKSGTSAYWFSMQVVNANGAVDKLEVSTDGGSTWQSTTRSSYNFFENTSGFGTDTVTVRVTGASGTTVTVSDVSVASEAQTTASSNC